MFLIGCSKPTNGENYVAYISANPESEYEKTIEELGMGILYDFQIDLPYADKTKVNLWIEGYKDGEKLPEDLSGIGFGHSPEKEEKGRLGFALFKPSTGEESLMIYTPSGRVEPHHISLNPIEASKPFGSGYGISNDQVGIRSGETITLAVFQQSTNNIIESFDFQDEDSINEMIEKGYTVLLYKMKAEKDK
ncbi:hypothetical protein [Bacillus pinisoli]|uniref:hypothetical protein n=1 Tax=Bacillus pinisoli TaxID=2901866 RepID=UPI001FF2993A|nr:hypothetical protein [Bacillus pinisoli]